MPLLPCTACGREISAAAPGCPHCGHPEGPDAPNTRKPFEVDEAKLAAALGGSIRAAEEKPSGRSTLTFVLLLLSVAIAAFTVLADLSLKTPALGGYLLALVLATWARIAQAAAQHRAVIDSLRQS